MPINENHPIVYTAKVETCPLLKEKPLSDMFCVEKNIHLILTVSYFRFFLFLSDNGWLKNIQ